MFYVSENLITFDFIFYNFFYLYVVRIWVNDLRVV